MTSTRPYLLRAFYDWICDNQYTPYLVINAEIPDVIVPVEYIQNGQIILNISPMVVTSLDLNNELITFDARFSGKSRHITAPVKAVMAIYAKENGQGIVFSEDELEDESNSDDTPSQPGVSKPHGKDKPKGRANLRVIK